jgi:hypothetical protein
MTLSQARSTWISMKSRLLIYGLFLAGIVFLIHHNILLKHGEQQFAYLAQSFLTGHLYFVTFAPYWDDTSFYAGEHYWPLGPLPAVILMPSVFLFGLRVHQGLGVQQGHFLLAINVVTLFILYRISLKITNSRNTSLWLTFAYVFSTAYLFIALNPWSWYFAQAVAALCLLLALHEFLYRKRPWLIGLYLALGVATRINLLCAGIFFAGSLLLEPGKLRDKVYALFQLMLPVAVSLLLLLLYNYLRFGNILEFGYHYQLIAHEPAVNREYGLWGFVHFPANLYYFLLKGPEAIFLPGSKILTYPFLQADIWGMSILFTSPILLWGLRAPVKKPVIYLGMGTSLIMMFVILGYYGIGVRQYGYRYALDFYPFLFLMLAYVCRERLTLPMRAIIIVSFLLNSYLILDSPFPVPVL